MDATWNDDFLTITIDAEEQAELQEIKDENPDEWWSDSTMYDFLEPIVANSELDWVSSDDTGDLTDAPMLAIHATEDEYVNEQKGPYGAMFVGNWGEGPVYAPILQRWGYEPYMVKSPLDELLATGKCVFRSSW